MTTLTTVSDRPNFAYYGDNDDWLVAYAIHRDSEALERSNFRTIRHDLESRFPLDVVIETFSHWAVGWTEEILVRPDTEAARAAEEWRAKLAEYPVADDEDWSEEENTEACESIADFVRYELRWFVGPKFEADQVAPFIVSAFWDAGEDTPGLPHTRWPHIDKQHRDPYTSHDRDRVARGIRAYRRFTREHRAS